MEEIFEIRSCIEIVVNDVKVDTTDQYYKALQLTELYTPCPEKKQPPKYVQITLRIENDSHYYSLCHEKPSICNVCVKFHDNQSAHQVFPIQSCKPILKSLAQVVF